MGAITHSFLVQSGIGALEIGSSSKACGEFHSCICTREMLFEFL